jgi:hypothetical protein
MKSTSVFDGYAAVFSNYYTAMIQFPGICLWNGGSLFYDDFGIKVQEILRDVSPYIFHLRIIRCFHLLWRFQGSHKTDQDFRSWEIFGDFAYKR